jgi:hypothetical protein
VKTVTIQIGNSDDKLSQSKWADFIQELKTISITCCHQVHFTGNSHGDAPWQNFCIVAECDDLGWIDVQLPILAKKYNQDSIACTVGTTIFLTPRN